MSFNATPLKMIDFGQKSAGELEAEVTYWRDKCQTIETELKGVTLEKDHWMKEAKDTPEVKVAQRRMAVTLEELEK